MDSGTCSGFCDQSRINATSTMEISEAIGSVRRKTDDQTTIDQKTVGRELSGQRIVGQDDVDQETADLLCA